VQKVCDEICSNRCHLAGKPSLIDRKSFVYGQFVGRKTTGAQCEMGYKKTTNFAQFLTPKILRGGVGEI